MMTHTPSLFEHPDDDTLYTALLERDARYEDRAYVCVTSTGIFCRLTCPARKPKRENTRFFGSIPECLEAGFRPCKRCKPLDRTGEASDMVRALVSALEADPDRRWSEGEIAALGHDPSTVRRAFKRHFGITFLEMARLRRLGRAAEKIGDGESVINAQIDAGFSSASGFREAFNRLIGQPPNGLKSTPVLRASWIPTPIGPMIAVADTHALHLVEFHDRPALKNELAQVQTQAQSAIVIGRTPVLDQLEHALTAYFGGQADAIAQLDAIPLSGHGSAFERGVWRVLRTVPSGETRSYGALARAIGRPTASRAVARANGANRLAILIPCHRIIGADGSLTGYGGGLWRKEWLLAHETRMTHSAAMT